MFTQILDNLDKKTIDSAVDKTSKLIKIPSNLYLYFLENIDLCYSIKLPRNIQKKFKLSCSHKSSFSFKFKKRKLIVIYADKQIMQNSDALIGLLLHEISHINQMDKGTYKQIYDGYNKSYLHNLKLFNSLKYDKKEIKQLFYDISLISILTLKDIYANTSLIDKKLTKYLIAYYKVEFSKKICPKPIFYKKLKIAKDDLSVIKTVFEFELSLLSVILPLYETKSAEKIVKIIESCYEINIQDISEKCHCLITLYFADFKKKNFNEEFIKLVFLKVYSILK